MNSTSSTLSTHLKANLNTNAEHIQSQTLQNLNLTLKQMADKISKNIQKKHRCSVAWVRNEQIRVAQRVNLNFSTAN